MDNQQLCNLSNEQLQVLLTGKFGDGNYSIPKSRNCNSYYQTNCRYQEYLLFKKSLLGDIAFKVVNAPQQGYGDFLFSLTTKRIPEITYLKNLDIESSLNLIDELGLALWFYDDGSLHKKKLFYNLCTHSFSREIQEEIIVPFLRNKFGIKAKVTVENKTDGRRFYYLRISKHEGAFNISAILSKYPVECYRYKLWSSETIQKWSKVQAYLKSRNMSVSYRKFSNLMSEVDI